MFKDLERLVVLNTANMDEEKKLAVINVLKEMFEFARTSKVLTVSDTIQAVLFGINCDLEQANNSLVFSGHIDTVPVKKDYSIDKDCFYGRGTADMKSFFSCLKKTFEAIDLNTISIPLIVAVSFDEETNNNGISAIKNYIACSRFKPRYCIVGEPTLSSCALSNHGCYDIIVTITGVEHHISNSQECDCFDTLLKALRLLDLIKKKYKQTEIKITFVHGGEKLNVVPAECKFGFQVRTMDYQNVIWICDEFRLKLKGNGNSVTLERLDNELPPFQNYNSHLASVVCKHNEGLISNFPATTEAGGYQALGIDTVICGPGDIQLAHTPHECIYFSDMSNYVMVLTKVISELNTEHYKQKHVKNKYLGM